MFFSKKNLLTAVFLCFFSFSVISQSNNQSSNNQAQLSTSAQNASESQETVTDDIPFYINPQTDTSEAEPSRFSTFFLFLRMILVLAFVIACIYAVLFLMKRSMKTNPNNSDPFLRRVSSVDLMPGKSVHVVTLLDHAYIVGVSDSSVNLIGELDRESEKDAELINAMNLYADEHQNVKKPKSFADILDIFMPSGPREKNGIFADIQKKMDKNLKNQRNDINGGEE